MSVDTPVFDGNCLFLKMFEWSEIRSDLKGKCYAPSVNPDHVNV